MEADIFERDFVDAIKPRILFEDEDLIILNKPAAIPVAPDLTGDDSLIDITEDYCGHPLKLIHRLDRPSSGIVIFAKSKHSCIHLSKQFKERALLKKYLAVVNKTNKLPTKISLEDKIFHNKKKNKSFIRSWMEDGGQVAQLSYELIDSIQHYALLEVNLHTGRHHQIRAQLANLGYPIKGDVKYGFKRGNRDRSIQLHAWKVSFVHPVNNQTLNIEVNPPAEDVWRHFDMFI